MSTLLWIIAMIIGAGMVVFMGGLIYGQGQRVTEEEKGMIFPGDHLITEEERVMRGQAAITINVPPSALWPYFEQMGQQHAGFYSFDWLERVCGFGINNIYDIRPEWQDNLRPGFFVFFHQNGIGMEVVQAVKEKSFVLYSDSFGTPQGQDQGARFWNPFPKGRFAFSWTFVLRELPGNRTRFIMRSDLHFSPRTPLTWLFTGVTALYPSFIMITRLTRSLKATAEKAYQQTETNPISG